MAGLIVLVGGDEFRPGCEQMDRAMLDATGAARPSLLVVPTAAALEMPAKAASNGVSYFSDLGADAQPLMVLEQSHANDETILSPVDSADVIYLTGGSPKHLLDTLAESLLVHKMKLALERGAVLVGSSAGAMVLGSWMRFRGWSRALGIVPEVATLPHHEGSDPEAVARELAASAPPGVTVLGIDVKTGCFGGPEQWEVLGQGEVTAYHAGRWQRAASGEVLTLGRRSTSPPPQSSP
jgi:cyanophycinase